MYLRYPKLDPQPLSALTHLAGAQSFENSVSYRRRIGAGGQQALSEYAYSRWYGWSRKDREGFQTCFPAHVVDRSVVGWFLKIPPTTGFLDRMTTWVGQKMAGTVLAYALMPEQELVLNDQVVTVADGEGVMFNLGIIHEIKPSSRGQLWACVMTPYAPSAFVADAADIVQL